MSKQKGIIFAALERLRSLTTYHASRFEAKEAARADGTYRWAFTTGKIHSTTTRTVYQQHILAFINWARDTHDVHHLALLDAHADEWATEYLSQHIAAGRSPYTIQAERAALRMFFSRRDLASTLALPTRTREQIHRSRGPVAQDRKFQPRNWQREIAFLGACGLRRAEALALLVGDVRQAADEQVAIQVRRGKGGRARSVPVLAGREQDVLSVVAGREPGERALGRLPVRLDVHALRRQYAQALYRQYAPERELPPSMGRLTPGDYDAQAARNVSEALGHRRLDVVLTHYIR